MGRDYLMREVDRWETIAGVEVPVDRDGHYLDWTDVSEDRKQARDLTSPYGSLNFVVGFGDEGAEDWMMCFDFAELPNGRIVLHSTVNSDSGGFIMDNEYGVADRETAAEDARRWVETALDFIEEYGHRHDEAGWNQSPCYFWRAVQAHVDGEDSPKRIVDKCPHGVDHAECDDCMRLSDFLADAAREDRFFGRS